MAGENNKQAKVIGPVPTLFVGVGPGAEGTFGALSRMAREMAVAAQGPFGLLSSNASGEALLASHWTWLSDFEMPASPEVCGLSEEVARCDDRLLAVISSLMRQLRSKDPVADPAAPGRVRLSSYVILDLSVAESVVCALRLMRIVRRADQGHDMAIVGLTGRSATSGSESDDVWFENWKALLTQLQGEPLAQKIYLLDGRNTSGTWLDRPEQLHRLGAEFLLYHGITCRGPLRQTERRRVSPKENVLSVCGSFGVRKIATNLPAVADRVARRLANEDLADLYGQTLSESAREHIEEGAQALTEKIEQIYDVPRKETSSSSSGSATEPGACALRNADVAQAIRKTIDHVCAHDPLTSVCHLLRCLQPRLRGLLTRYRLMERGRTRRFVGEVLQQQREETYEPLKVWLSKPHTEWVDRFTPAQGPPSHVVLSRVPGRTGYRAGLSFFVLGLVGITSGLLLQERVFAFGGGLLSLAATVLMTLPTGWTRQARSQVPHGRDIPKSVPPISYRRRLPLVRRCVAFLLAALGVTALAWSLWPGAWSSTMMLPAVVSALIGLVGVGVLLGGPIEVRPDQVREREAPGHLGPPVWSWRGAGLLCLAGAWSVLHLGASPPVRLDTVAQWGAHLSGLACLIVAAIVGLRARMGRVRLVDYIARVPEPFCGGIAGPTADSDAIREVAAMTEWIGRVNLEPQQCGLRGGPGGLPENREVLFDLMAPDWDRRLAEAFRRTLQTRSGETFRDLAREPKAWSTCLVRELQEPETERSDLGVIFALEAVRAWMDSLTLKDLVRLLEVDVSRFNGLVARIAAPNWPSTRTGPEVSVGVLAVCKALRDVLKPLAHSPGALPVVEVDGKSSGDGMLVLRVVQGLTGGWRGYPAMPGQQQNSAPTSPTVSEESPQGTEAGKISRSD